MSQNISISIEKVAMLIGVCVALTVLTAGLLWFVQNPTKFVLDAFAMLLFASTITGAGAYDIAEDMLASSQSVDEVSTSVPMGGYEEEIEDHCK